MNFYKFSSQSIVAMYNKALINQLFAPCHKFSDLIFALDPLVKAPVQNILPYCMDFKSFALYIIFSRGFKAFYY